MCVHVYMCTCVYSFEQDGGVVVKDDRQMRWNGNQNYASEQIDASNLDRLTNNVGICKIGSRVLRTEQWGSCPNRNLEITELHQVNYKISIKYITYTILYTILV